MKKIFNFTTTFIFALIMSVGCNREEKVKENFTPQPQQLQEKKTSESARGPVDYEKSTGTGTTMSGPEINQEDRGEFSDENDETRESMEEEDYNEEAPYNEEEEY